MASSEFNDKIALITWNSSALFGSIHGVHERQTATFNEFKKLLITGDVVLVQEAHGFDEDRVTLERECSSHYHFGSAHSSPNSGGVLTSVSKVFARGFTRALFIVIEKGRCLVTFLSGTNGNICIVNVHVEPLKTPAEKTRLFRKIREAIPPFITAITFMGGDFNLSLDVADRVTLEDGSFHGGSDPMADSFSEMFRDFLEVTQSDYTRRQVRHGKIASLAKIDRWFTTLSSVDLLDRSAIAATTIKVTNLRFPSDHVPVLLRVESLNRLPPSSASIPRWVTEHPSFINCLNDTLLVLARARTECPR
jgi:exonuclease III